MKDPKTTVTLTELNAAKEHRGWRWHGPLLRCQCGAYLLDIGGGRHDDRVPLGYVHHLLTIGREDTP